MNTHTHAHTTIHKSISIEMEWNAVTLPICRIEKKPVELGHARDYATLSHTSMSFDIVCVCIRIGYALFFLSLSVFLLLHFFFNFPLFHIKSAKNGDRE